MGSKGMNSRKDMASNRVANQTWINRGEINKLKSEPAGGGAGVSVKISLTAEQLRNLNTTPLVLVGAQGPNTVITVLSCIAKLNFGTVPFDAMGYIYIDYSTDFGYAEGQDFDSSSSGVINFELDFSHEIDVIMENEPLLFIGEADSTVGDSTVDLFLTYKVIDLS